MHKKSDLKRHTGNEFALLACYWIGESQHACYQLQWLAEIVVGARLDARVEVAPTMGRPSEFMWTRNWWVLPVRGWSV